MDDLSGNAKDAADSLAKKLPPFDTSDTLVCLNFKVPLRVRLEFKIYAARHNMTMTELLLFCASWMVE